MGKREDNRTEKEQLILTVAERLFLTKGFEETQMDQVARESGISKGLLFYYYGSKDSLALAILYKHTMAEVQDLRERVRDISGESLTKLFTLLTSIIDHQHGSVDRLKPLFRLRQYVLSRVLSDSMSTTDRALFGRIFQASVAPFVELIEEGIRDGSIRNDVSPFDAAVQISVPLGTTLEYHAGLVCIDPVNPLLTGEHVRSLLTTLIHNLKPREGHT